MEIKPTEKNRFMHRKINTVYKINVNHPVIRVLYDRYKKWKGIKMIPSDKERFEFEHYIEQLIQKRRETKSKRKAVHLSFTLRYTAYVRLKAYAINNINIISYHTGTVNKRSSKTEFFRPCIGYYLINGMVMMVVCIERKIYSGKIFRSRAISCI